MSQVRQVVEALMKHGPKYTTISRETGVPVTTVRYILREKLPKLGFTIRPAINYGRLGLQRYLVMLESTLSPHYLINLLDLFGDTMYLSYYAYLLNDNKFLTIFSIPPKFEYSLTNLLDELAEFNVIQRYDFKKLLYRRIIPLRVDCFDFNNGVWMQNWDEMQIGENVPEIYEEPSPINELTLLDLKILFELYMNPFASYTDVASKLNITRQTVKRHYQKVLPMIYLYNVFWMPRDYPELVCTPILIRTYLDGEVRKIMLNIPFTHVEMRTENSEYYTILFVPSLGFYKVLKYIGEKRIFKQVHFLSMEYAANFTFPLNLYNDKKGWINIFEVGLQKILKEVKLTE